MASQHAPTDTPQIDALPLGLIYVLITTVLFGIAIVLGANIALDGPKAENIVGVIALIPGPAVAWVALRDVDPHMAMFGLVPSALVLTGWIGLAMGEDAAFFTIPLYLLTAIFTATCVVLYRPR